MEKKRLVENAVPSLFLPDPEIEHNYSWVNIFPTVFTLENASAIKISYLQINVPERPEFPTKATLQTQAES